MPIGPNIVKLIALMLPGKLLSYPAFNTEKDYFPSMLTDFRIYLTMLQ